MVWGAGLPGLSELISVPVRKQRQLACAGSQHAPAVPPYSDALASQPLPPGASPGYVDHCLSLLGNGDPAQLRLSMPVGAFLVGCAGCRTLRPGPGGLQRQPQTRVFFCLLCLAAPTAIPTPLPFVFVQWVRWSGRSRLPPSKWAGQSPRCARCGRRSPCCCPAPSSSARCTVPCLSCERCGGRGGEAL